MNKKANIVIVFILLAAVGVGFYFWYKTQKNKLTFPLQIGSSGSEIVKLQRILNKQYENTRACLENLFPPLQITGVFDKATANFLEYLFDVRTLTEKQFYHLLATEHYIDFVDYGFTHYVDV